MTTHSIEPPILEPSPFKGLRVAVTGGTSGLGLALVEALGCHGAEVAFVARTARDVRAVARRVPGAHGIDGDVARKDETHAIAMRTTAALGGLDLLIHNASSLGPAPLKLLADTECEELQAAVATNLIGPFRLTKALLGALTAAAREGRPATVIHITSDAAVNAYAGWGAYGATKAALRQMSRIWNEELGEHGVAVLDFDPGDMDTRLHALAVPDADRTALKKPSESAGELLAVIAARVQNEVAA